MATDMNDILSDKPIEPEKPTEQPAAAEAPAPEAKAESTEEKAEKARSRRRDHQRKEWEAQGRDPETGQFLPKAEEKKEEAKADEKPAETKAETKAEAKPEEKKEPAAQPPKQEMTEKERAFLKAAEEERRKRQALERELAQLRATGHRDSMQQQQNAQQPAGEKKFWDDPEAALAKHRQEIQQTAVQARIQTSEMLARQQYPDFDEKANKFAELVQQNPALGQQFIAATHPAEFAYRTAKSILDIEQAGGVDKLVEERVAKARAEERAKVEAELKKREEEAAAKRAALPPSLSDVQGAGRRPSPQWTGPTPMGDILKH